MNKIYNYEEILNHQSSFIIAPKGTSMMPLLREGIDTVQIKKINEPLKKLDVVLFKRIDGTYVLHRIIKIKKDYYLICGDNQGILEKVYPNQIIGAMEGYFRAEEYISCTDVNYLKYSKKRTRSRIFRYIRNTLSRIYHKIKK